MPTFETKYSDDQREAAAVAYLDRRIRPARRVVELAARGELEINGKALEPFEMGEDAVRTFASRLRKARAGQLKTGLTDIPPRDAVEQLRRRLVSAADHMLAAIEKRQRAKRPERQDPELLRQIARAVREVAAIPGPTDPRPPAPGQKIPGGQGAKNGERTTGGLAGSILAAHQGGPVYTPPCEGPRQSAPQQDSASGEQSATHTTQDTEPEAQSAAPGAWMREQVDRMGPRVA